MSPTLNREPENIHPADLRHKHRRQGLMIAASILAAFFATILLAGQCGSSEEDPQQKTVLSPTTAATPAKREPRPQPRGSGSSRMQSPQSRCWEESQQQMRDLGYRDTAANRQQAISFCDVVQ